METRSKLWFDRLNQIGHDPESTQTDYRRELRKIWLDNHPTVAKALTWLANWRTGNRVRVRK